MSAKKLILGLLTLGLVQVASADGEVVLKESEVALNSAFIPGGFDSQSDVYVIVSGMFPNTCYTWERATVAVDTEKKIVEVAARAMVTQGIACLRVLVPFQKEVNVGVLPAGDYSLRFSNGDGTYFYEPLHVEP